MRQFSGFTIVNMIETSKRIKAYIVIISIMVISIEWTHTNAIGELNCFILSITVISIRNDNAVFIHYAMSKNNQGAIKSVVIVSEANYVRKCLLDGIKYL